MSNERARRPRGASGRLSARRRLALLLTLAVLPIGVIALVQSQDVADHAREMAQRALIGEAIRVAAAQRAVVRTAQGQAKAMGPATRGAGGDAGACTLLMSQVVQETDAISFAGFVSPDGYVRCSSDGATREAAQSVALNQLETAVLSGRDVPDFLDSTLAVVQPVVGKVSTEAGVASEKKRLGSVLLGLSEQALLTSDAIPGTEPAALDLATLNRAGEMLWSSPVLPGTIVGSRAEAAAQRLPAATDLGALAAQPPHVFLADDGSGAARAFAAVPVIEGQIVTLASWQPGSLFDDPGGGPFTLGVLLPIAMWLLSLTVAYISVNRLILEPLASLRERMSAFTQGDRALPPFQQEGAPQELMDLADSFDAMTQRIVEDESRLEKAIHDQEVLLKEVHHRVKNNLQLIASILNMQIRQHRTRENRAVLRRVQDRVMSLATVHQHLYQTSSITALKADTLLREIINRKLADAGPVAREIQVDTRLAPIPLYPDQAVPLALLVSEAVTNVFHHVGRPNAEQEPWMRVSLEEQGEGVVVLEVANSGGEKLTETQSEYRAGLGTRLISAFARQLDGSLDRKTGDGDGAEWILRLHFLVQGFDAGEHPPAAADDGEAPG